MIRSCIQKLHAYTPGEQPRVKGLIKLNTNENPYPPSPRVMVAIRRELNSNLRLYPDPVSLAFRKAIAQVFGFKIDQVIAGNGSDDILTLILRTFVDEGSKVQFPRPTYSLYPVLTQIQNGKIREVPYDKNRFQLRENDFDPHASVTFVVNPNAPTGTVVPMNFLSSLSKRLKGVLVVDEAYADFAKENALGLARKATNVIATRSLSKSYSLAGMRLGFAVGHRRLIDALFKVKDSYNLDRLAQVAGTAAISDQVYLRKNVARVVRTREVTSHELEKRGWRVLPSQANFVFARPPLQTAEIWLKKLREKKILVRWFGARETRDYLRITLGTDRQMKRFLVVADQIALSFRKK